MTTNSTPSTPPAVEIARAIAGCMPGWTLGPDSLRHIAEGDSVQAWHADLVNPTIAGAEININTTRDKGRINISAAYPRDWQPYIDGGRRYSESITVALTKTPAQIARDINRRLFEATGYFSHLADCLARKAAAEDQAATAERIARTLAASIEVSTISDRYAGVRNCNHLIGGDNTRRFETRAENNGRPRLAGEVSYNGSRVELKITELSPAQAEQLLEAFRRLQAGA